jgi:hypothetical protein
METRSEQQKLFQSLFVAGIAVLSIGLIGNLYLVWRNIGLYRETQRRAIRLQVMESQMREWQQFLGELAEYSRQQPAIDPILQKYLVKQSAPASKSR